jgi:Flp pilus assembly protein CpaB
MVEVVSVPNNLVIPGAFFTLDTAVGQRARYPIAPGEQLTGNKVGVEPEGSGLQYVLPKGKRAVGIDVNEVTQVGGNLLAGQRVDIGVAFQASDPAEPVVAYTILRDVEVLAVAQSAQEAAPVSQDKPGSTDNAAESSATSGNLPEDLQEQPSALTVTVAVDPLQVELLSCVQDHPNVKRVWLMLRAFGEPAPEADKAMTVPPACQLTG